VNHRPLLRGVVLAVCLLTTLPLFSQTIPVTETMWRLTAQEDTDGDQKITIHDRVTPFVLRDQRGVDIGTLTNFYEMSLLLQDLKLAADSHTNQITMDHLQLDESPVERTHRFIRDKFWNALTRRIDADNIDTVMRDSKADAKLEYLYVPAADPVAVKYFQAVEKASATRHHSPPLKIVMLPSPDHYTGDYVRNLDGEHGLLSLKLELDSAGNPVAGVPYVVPGGRFNELYGWDS
jgi:alpha,alpha-trehalase